MARLIVHDVNDCPRFNRTMSVLLETSLGDIVIDLEVELCPKTCENFLKLCKVYYYNLNAFFNGTLHSYRIIITIFSLNQRFTSIERLLGPSRRSNGYRYRRRVYLVPTKQPQHLQSLLGPAVLHPRACSPTQTRSKGHCFHGNCTRHRRWPKSNKRRVWKSVLYHPRGRN